MPDGVIFDMDGVLVDSGAAHHESWQVVARRHGIDVSAERFNQTFGRPSRDIIRIVWGADVTDEQIDEIDGEKEAAYRDLVRGNIPLMPGCRDVLASLKDAGYALAVGTSGPPENVDLVLADGGIGDFFAARVHGFDIEHGKPAPDCFLLAAERLGQTPAQCVVIEDAPVGVQAGVAAGMRVIALVGTHPADPLRDAGALRVVERLGDVTPALIARVLRDGAKGEAMK